MIDFFALCILIFIGLNSLKLLVETVAIIKSVKVYKRRLRNRKNIITYNGHEDVETWPFVSIVKPICMDNVKMKRIIESFFQIDYPAYEIHFCFQSKTNSCIQFIQQISPKYPKIKTYIHSDAVKAGHSNNKIINAAQGYGRAKGEFVWVVDENVRCYVSVLKEMITQFDHKDVACVHQVPLVQHCESFDNTIAMTYFATHHTRYIYFCDSVGIVCLAGMSMMYDREKLEEIGGIRAFSRFLSEDYFLAHAFVTRGYEIRLSHTPAIQEGGDITLRAFCDRMIRWTKLRFSIHFFTTLAEPFVHPLFYSLVSALTLSYLIHTPFIFIFAIYIFGNFIVDQLFVTLTRLMFPEGGELQSLRMRIQAYFCLQFFLIPYIFAKSLRNRRLISWKGIDYKISQKTIISSDESENKKSVVLSKRYQRFREIQAIEP